MVTLRQKRRKAKLVERNHRISGGSAFSSSHKSGWWARKERREEKVRCFPHEIKPEEWPEMGGSRQRGIPEDCEEWSTEGAEP